MLHSYHKYTLAFAFIGMLTGSLLAQEDTLLSSESLKSLSLDELFNIEVSSVSNNPEKLTEVASAIQVITSNNIRRSGVTRIPEALRLASNLQIGQSNSHDWSISARGFNGLPSAGGILANKLLVMNDGRSLYTPLFGGVFWDVQNYILEDIDRIEVVSGPGGTLWGANAVNGVINIITKDAKETQGVQISRLSGSLLQDNINGRYGFKIGSKLYGRVYGRYLKQRGVTDTTGASFMDKFETLQMGFRMDYYHSDKNTFTFQGDAYSGFMNDKSNGGYAVVNGQNLIGKYTHTFSETSDLRVQMYFDRTSREFPNNDTSLVTYELLTYDLDIRHRFALGKRQSILWGVGYQQRNDKTNPDAYVLYKPVNRDMPTPNAFVQDEISIIPNKLKFTIGSKFLNNVFTGFEVQPSARLAFIPNKKHTIWTAVSRAVRVPSRFDADLAVIEPFKSEKVMAYELGYRVRPFSKLSLSFATFYNHYDDLRSLDVSIINGEAVTYLANSQLAESHGLEFSGQYQLLDWWNLNAGYSYVNIFIWPSNNKVIPISHEFEAIDPRHILRFQSMMDLDNNVQLDFTARYVGALNEGRPTNNTDAYFTFDARMAWQYDIFEFSVVGQNLFEDKHVELGSTQIPRSVYGKVVVTF